MNKYIFVSALSLFSANVFASDEDAFCISTPKFSNDPTPLPHEIVFKIGWSHNWIFNSKAYVIKNQETIATLTCRYRHSFLDKFLDMKRSYRCAEDGVENENNGMQLTLFPNDQSGEETYSAYLDLNDQPKGQMWTLHDFSCYPLEK